MHRCMMEIDQLVDIPHVVGTIYKSVVLRVGKKYRVKLGEMITSGWACRG